MLSPHRDRGTMTSVVLEVAASSLAELTEDRGEEDSGLRNTSVRPEPRQELWLFTSKT